MTLRGRLARLLTLALAGPVDGLAGLLPAGPAGNDVIIVRLDGIGDFLLWTDAAARLAGHWRAEGRRVVLLANAAWAELAETMGVFDQVWRLDRRRFQLDPKYRFEMMRRLRRAGFAIAAQPTLSRELAMGDAAIRAAGRHRRIGSAGDMANRKRWERWLGDRWYTELLPAIPGPLMELERNAEFLRGLGIAAEPRLGRLGLPPSPPVVAGGDYFVLVPGGSWEGKRWPAKAFAELAGRIAAATGWRGVLAGGPDDREVAAEVLRGAAAGIVLEDRTGTTSLTGLAALLGGARLVVANDTGAVHLAALQGTATVAIVGGGHYGRFLPYTEGAAAVPPRVVHHPMECYGCNWACCHPRAAGEAVACLRRVTVEAVWEVVGVGCVE